MNTKQARIRRMVDYLCQIVPNRQSLVEAKLRLIFFWAEWHAACQFQESLTDTSWQLGELGPENREFTEAILGGTTASEPTEPLTNRQKIALEAGVQALGLVPIRQAIADVRALWVSRQAVWHQPMDMVALANRYNRLVEDKSVRQTTKEMDRQEILSGEFSADNLPVIL